MAAQRANQNGLAESLEALTLPPGAGPLRPSGSALLAAEGRTAQAAGKTAAKESVEVANKAQETGRKLKAVEEAKKCPCPEDAGGLIIGKLEDLEKDTGWRPGDRTLNLPPLPPGPERWNQNAKALQDAINEGKPIRDVSPAKGGGFLDRERQLLRDNGWTFDPNTNLWQP